MTHLLLGLLLILSLYGLLMLMIMKLILSWRYKAFIYGALTFFMLIAVFLSFSHYEKHWKHMPPAAVVRYTETV
jgi:hypothetical protein